MHLPEAVKYIIDELNRRGHEAYAVGGCVRDALLGKQPNDWDICTSALPEETLTLFGEKNCILTGLKHGTITVKMDGGFYEVTTFRTDGEYSDGRHPDSVDFVDDVCADLARRDFTINAMAYNDRDGLVDPFGGREDLLKHRIVRAVGDPMARFAEDALRVMRLFRFAARYGLNIDEETKRAAIALCGNLRFVSGERTREELLKLLCAAKPSAYLPKDVVSVFMPEMKEISIEAYGHALSAVDALKPDGELRLAALLSVLCTAQDQGKAAGVMKRLHCSNKTMNRVQLALSGALGAYDADDEALRVQARYALGRHGTLAIEDILALARVLRETDAAQRVERFAAHAFAAKAQGLCCSLKELAITGEDVMKIAGPGPKVGALLSALLDVVIRGEVPNERKALLEAAERMEKK